MDIEAKLRELIDCSAVDEDIMEYVVSILGDPDTAEQALDDVVESVAPFLLETGAVPDMEALQETVKSVLGRSGEDESGKTAHVLEKLDAPVNLESLGDTTSTEWADYMKKFENPTYVNVDAVKKAEEKQRERNEKRAAKEAARLDKKREREGILGAILATGNGIGAQGMLVRREDEMDSEYGRDIHIDGVNLNYGKNILLEEATLQINYGRRYGLVGRNGCGKSTLLRAIANRDVRYSKAMSVLYVQQEITGDDTTVLDAVLSADVERTELLAEEKRILAINPNSETLVKIYNRLQEIDADGAAARASMILTGLSFTDEMKKRATKEFSGGWRMRIALARALFCEPDLLLLDEPTNHLDFHAVIWLERFLSAWKSTLVIVSHQRTFLNSVATDICHLYGKKLTYYKGDYDTFERVANERIQHQKAEYESQQIQRQQIQRFLDRFHYNAKRSSLVQSRLKMWAKRPVIAAVVEEGAVVLPMPNPDYVPPPIMVFNDVSFGYTPDKPIFKHVSLNIDLDTRIALVGANGCGKTTFLKLLLGEIEPQGGHVTRNGKVRVGYFCQHFVDSLDLGITAIDVIKKQYPKMTTQEIRAHLSKYGISGDTVLQTLNTLSGGQKSRVVFAQIALREPHIILLDEPSNHLDIETIEGLAQSLTAFQGGIVMVSHDQRLISLCCDEVWVVGDGTVNRWPGDVMSYRMHVEKSMAYA